MWGIKGGQLAAFPHTNLYLLPELILIMESYYLHSESDCEYLGRRKGMKLVAEKRRRWRINRSLKHIKDIVFGKLKEKNHNFDKIEKAEILETTVDYLRNVRKINTAHQMIAETVQARFQQGFSRCAEEILTYIQTVPGVSDNVQHQLRKHLSDRLGNTQQVPVTSSQLMPLTSDSGVECLPESVKYSSSKVRQSYCHSDSELFSVQTRLSPSTLKDSRVSAWVESTLSYSQQVQMEQRAPWRPW